jgi:hypothetical protein
VLVQLGDVGAVLEQEGGDGGDDARAVRAGDQQAGGGFSLRGHEDWGGNESW